VSTPVLCTMGVVVMFYIESHWIHQNTWKSIVCCLFSCSGINAFRMASSNSSPAREILRMRVYRIPSRDFLLLCGQHTFRTSGFFSFQPTLSKSPPSSSMFFEDLPSHWMSGPNTNGASVATTWLLRTLPPYLYIDEKFKCASIGCTMVAWFSF
jgi:hypothetical protein